MKPREDIEIIYQAALPVFSRFGYQKTTMADIANRMNMTQGNLYVYVKNKKDLYRKTVSHALMKWQGKVLEAVEAEGDLKQKFVTMCEKAVQYLSLDTDLRDLLIHDPEIFPMFPAKDPYEEINRNSVALIRSILQQGIAEKIFRPVDPDRVAEVIFMVYKMFIIRMYIKTEDVRIQKMFEDTVELITHGLFVDDSTDPSII